MFPCVAESAGGDSERGLWCAVLSTSLQEEAIHRRCEASSGSAQHKQAADGGGGRDVCQAVQSLHLHKHSGQQQRRLHPGAERHQRLEGDCVRMLYGLLLYFDPV